MTIHEQIQALLKRALEKGHADVVRNIFREATAEVERVSPQAMKLSTSIEVLYAVCGRAAHSPEVKAELERLQVLLDAELTQHKWYDNVAAALEHVLLADADAEETPESVASLSDRERRDQLYAQLSAKVDPARIEKVYVDLRATYTAAHPAVESMEAERAEILQRHGGSAFPLAALKRLLELDAAIRAEESAWRWQERLDAAYAALLAAEEEQ